MTTTIIQIGNTTITVYNNFVDITIISKDEQHHSRTALLEIHDTKIMDISSTQPTTFLDTTPN